jgi:hypothetical protein
MISLTMNEVTQHHHWGVIEHGIKQLVYSAEVADEFLWEFVRPEEVLENMFGLDVVNDWLAKGGGFELVDTAYPLPRFHKVTVWAYHADPRQLTLISLKLL